MSCCCCEPMEILITSQDFQDDDIRVRVNNTTVFDPRCNVGWYRGEITEIGNPAFNSGYATGGFRVARIDVARDVHAVHHCRVRPGAVISVDTFDGWSGTWQTAPWVAELRWRCGAVWMTEGGALATGDSILMQDTSDPNYYALGPYFDHYIPNGSFVVPCPPRV